MASTPVNVSWGDAQLLFPKPASLDHSAPQSRQLGTVNSEKKEDQSASTGCLATRQSVMHRTAALG